MTEEIYRLLVDKAHLVRAPVPVNKQGTEPATFIFHTADYATKDKLLVMMKHFLFIDQSHILVIIAISSLIRLTECHVHQSNGSRIEYVSFLLIG